MAGQDHSAAQSALNELFLKYWRPIYAFARHRGCASHDAEDITQAYFARLLERDYIQRANQDRGRFRAFLIHDFKFFLSNERGKERAEKRGGNVSFISIDVASVESRLEQVAPEGMDADAYFDRQWALEVVRHAKDDVRADYEKQGKMALFDALQAGLVSTPDAVLYAVWEQKLNMNTNALKTALHRLRERFRAALEAQILETVSNVDELKVEMRHLRKALSQSPTPGA